MEHLLELFESSIEVEQFGASLPNEVIVEPVSPEHLHEQPAEVAEALVSGGEQ